MILEVLPNARTLVSYVQRNEDPRDYRVKFEKIRELLHFKSKHTVRDGIREVVHAINTDLISDCDNNQYRNTPLKPEDAA